MTQPPSHPTVPPADAYPGQASPPPPPGQPPAGYGVPPGFAHPTPPPPPTSPAGQPLASFSDRLLALLIDSAIMVAVVMVLIAPAMLIAMYVIMKDSFELAPDGTYPTPDFFADFFLPLLLVEAVVILLTMIMSYVYYVEMMFRTGQTFGKKSMKIKVVPLDPTATLDRATTFRRFLVQNLAAGFVPGFSYVDGLWQLWDKPYQQCLHDKFARTVVVKVPG
ncbi:hypothetical protein GCM10027290_34840 [Micromonospora sonneratiae]|uniref:RDD family protein n=1 Tax=Micromonospora sonneratiae TaxID=1184706 RepID=A0ABW3Y8J4_9ACTN